MQASVFLTLLPAMIWWLIGAAFLVLWHIRFTTWHCSIGFMMTGTGFALDAFPMASGLSGFLSGLCYIAAAYCYSACILAHFEIERRFWARPAIVLGYVALHTLFTFVTPNLRADLFLTDMTFASLFFLILWPSRSRIANAADRLFLVAGGLTATECVVRAVVFTFVMSSPADWAAFANSNYSIAVQCTSLTIGLLYPISVLTAAATRTIARHRDAADLDPLTGLFNRRGFFRLVAARRAGRGASGVMLMADIDHFKRINDGYGHRAGDGVIAALAEDLADCLSTQAILARVGGEEFCAYLPDKTMAEALVLAQTVNTIFAARHWQATGIDRPITVSIGLALLDAEDHAIDAAIDRADRALYVAKETGRNRVMVNAEKADRSDTEPADSSALLAERRAG